jgi:alcohol dehydrogenase (cytochrome c)
MNGDVRKGDNLFTACIVALSPDTGKMVWYFQASPHDTHDWDATETPVLLDGEINGQKRKLLAQASRNGWFFVLDRATGKNIVSSEFVKTNWSKGLDAKGQPIPNPAKEPQLDGALVSPNNGGATNWAVAVPQFPDGSVLCE